MAADAPVCYHRHRLTLPPPGPSLQQGVTLLELLIALTLLGLITVMLYGGLHLGIRSSEIGEQRADTMEQIRLIQSFIRREVSQAYPLLWTGKGKRRVAFRGEPQRLRFAAILPLHRGVGGLYLVSIGVDQGASGSELVFSYRLATPEIQGLEALEEPNERVVLLRDLEGVDFSYYGKQVRGEGPPPSPSPFARGREGVGVRSEESEGDSWQTHWNDPKNLPRLVRLRLKTRDGSIWPELVIPIHAKVHPNEIQLVVQAPRESGLGEPQTLDPEDMEEE